MDAEEQVTGTFKRLAPGAWDAIVEALASFFHFKDDLARYLRTELADHPELLGALDFQEPKVITANDLVRAMQRRESKYQQPAIDLLVRLGEEDRRFHRLARLEDGPDKVRRAQIALDIVLEYTDRYSELAKSRERLQAELDSERAAAAERRTMSSELARLREQFLELQMTDGPPQRRGVAFEELLNKLFELFDVYPRAAYELEHQQIDGAFTFETDEYLLEAKWLKGRVGPDAVNHFASKIRSKAKNTLGLFISVNGFTEGAVHEHSNATAVIFADGTDLYAVLDERIRLDEMLRRKKRHAAETGNPFYPASDMI